MFLVPRFRYFKLVFYPYVFNMISFLLKLVGLRPGPVICSVCEDSNLGPIAVDSRSTRKGDEAAGMPVNNNWGGSGRFSRLCFVPRTDGQNRVGEIRYPRFVEIRKSK